MKIILLQDVYKKGVAGEVVDVAPGYARNYLIPQGMAVKATPGALRQLENLRKQAGVRRAEQEQEFDQIAEKIESLTLYFPVKAGETGKLYGSVTPAQIAEQLQTEIGLEFDRRRIGDRPLRELGGFAVPVRLDTGLTPTVKVVIFREGTEPPVEAIAEGTDTETTVEEEAEAEALEESTAEVDNGSPGTAEELPPDEE